MRCLFGDLNYLGARLPRPIDLSRIHLSEHETTASKVKVGLEVFIYLLILSLKFNLDLEPLFQANSGNIYFLLNISADFVFQGHTWAV